MNLALLSQPRPQDLQYGVTIIGNGLRKAVCSWLSHAGRSKSPRLGVTGENISSCQRRHYRGFLFTLGTSLSSDKKRFAMLPRELFLQIHSFTSQGPESTRATTKNNRGFCTLEKLPSATGFTLASAFKTRDVVKLAGNHRAEFFKVGLRLVRNLNSDLKAKKAYSVKFFLSTMWWLDDLKRIEKIIRENAFELKEKKPGSKI